MCNTHPCFTRFNLTQTLTRSFPDELFHSTAASCAEEARTHTAALRVDNVDFMGTDNFRTMALFQALSIIPSTLGDWKSANDPVYNNPHLSDCRLRLRIRNDMLSCYSLDSQLPGTGPDVNSIYPIGRSRSFDFISRFIKIPPFTGYDSLMSANFRSRCLSHPSC